MRLLLQTIRGEFALFAVNLALPLVRAMDAARCDPRLADLADLYPRAGSLIVVGRISAEVGEKHVVQ